MITCRPFKKCFGCAQTCQSFQIDDIQIFCFCKTKINSDKWFWPPSLSKLPEKAPHFSELKSSAGISAFQVLRSHFCVCGGIQVETVFKPLQWLLWRCIKTAQYSVILTTTVCVVMLVGAGRTGSQALAALGAQQGQLGATWPALQATGTGGAGWLAGCGWERRGRAAKTVTVSHLKYSFSPHVWGFSHGCGAACAAQNASVWLLVLTGMFSEWGGSHVVPQQS